MNFKPELVIQILAGRKTVTRRKRVEGKRCRYQEGKDYAICPGRGQKAVARMLVTSISPEVLGDVTNEEARLEGFPDGRIQFLTYWSALNGQADLKLPVWRIKFELMT